MSLWSNPEVPVDHDGDWRRAATAQAERAVAARPRAVWTLVGAPSAQLRALEAGLLRLGTGYVVFHAQPDELCVEVPVHPAEGESLPSVVAGWIRDAGLRVREVNRATRTARLA